MISVVAVPQRGAYYRPPVESRRAGDAWRRRRQARRDMPDEKREFREVPTRDAESGDGSSANGSGPIAVAEPATPDVTNAATSQDAATEAAPTDDGSAFLAELARAMQTTAAAERSR